MPNEARRPKLAPAALRWRADASSVRRGELELARVALDAPARWVTLLFLVGVLSSGGCHYNVGNSFPSDVQTVYVPIFTNEDFRRGVEFQLTDAVQKQIQQRSHFRLVKDNSADTK